MRSTFFFTEEPKGETYKNLLQLASARCQTFSLTWRLQTKFKDTAHQVAAALEEYKVSERQTKEWPGTQLGNGEALVRYYRLNKKSIVVLDEVEGLYSWLIPELPEDLAFYLPKEVCWMGSIAHEQEAWIEDKTLTLEDFKRAVPGLKIAHA
jgi:hypothetical protein